MAPLPANASNASNASNATVHLMGDSCGSASQCIAVGGAQVLTDSGGSWTAAEAPLPANASTSTSSPPDLMGVSCSSASHCVAVGSYSDVSGAEDGLVLTLG